MKKLLSFLKPYKVSIVVALFFMLFELVVELLMPLFMSKIIDQGVLQKDLSVVVRWGAIMIGISLLSFASGILNSFYAAHAGQSFGHDIRKSLFERVQSLNFEDFQRFPTSSLITRMTNDVTQIQNTVFMSLRIMLRAPLFVFGGIMMAFIVNYRLALILITVVPVLILFLRWALNKAGKLFRSSQGKLDRVNSVMRENLVGMRLIKVLLRGTHETKRFEQANDELMKRTVSALRLIEFTMPFLLMVMNICILGVLWFGSIQVGAGETKVGEVVAVVNYGTRIASSLSIFSMIILVFSRAKASGQRILEVLNAEIRSEIFSEEDNGTQLLSEGKVQFDAVSFRYPGTTEQVLENISFTANPGSMIALLGATGSGKTSLFQLIPRLYEVNGGAIYIDDHDIQSINPGMLRKQIGFVPQETLLFSGTIKDNLAWGKEGASEEEMVIAAKDAQIHETILKLPKQYDAVIGQKGVNLSGGQKQRLAIARALIRKPKILLFDDSTSALDLKTEAKLLEAIKQYTCTTFIITQKISTAMGADLILLLEGGKLIAKGRHEVLLKDSSLYRQIYQSQFGEEKVTHVQ
ncbi:ABC transporter ATP-binding protein [Bacillus sp. 1NLA3E]|uniref:ABC transporter ATP-binding protein n=1 Tax=Bacillus sp. 1NLA3E TaxID=666686 RepID=UPI000247E7C8|nr:ABC transporter ATP-binding protein [Bacillus sp. 1NLA3E]AGK52207.1 maltose and maltodextrin ABC transporter subunit ATP-binding protein MalQ [Bacillus sp. 1NLA3E]